jgi:HNH endonuclease/NUMOD4 motif
MGVPDPNHAEVWKQIPTIPTHEVSDKGRVRRMADARNWKAGKILSPQQDRKGYLWVAVSGYHRSIHSLVCEAFNGPRKPGQICRHLNDDKDDIRPDNLAWGTHLDNSADQRRNGREPRYRRRFDRSEARRLRGIGLTVEEVGYWLGVSGAAISLGLKSMNRTAT